MYPAYRQSTQETKLRTPCSTAPLAPSLSAGNMQGRVFHNHLIHRFDSDATEVPDYTPAICSESTVTSTPFTPPRISRYLSFSVNNKQLSTTSCLSVSWDLLLPTYPNILTWKEVKEKELSGSRSIHLFPWRTQCISKNVLLFFFL